MRHPKKGEFVSFAAAAASSNIPSASATPSLIKGARVRVSSLRYEHTAVVLHHTGSVGLDGRNWVQVAVFASARDRWEAHFEASDVVPDRSI